MQVSATDADIRSNAEITYTLFGPSAEKFKLNPDTGKDGVWGKINRVPMISYMWVVIDHTEFEIRAVFSSNLLKCYKIGIF